MAAFYFGGTMKKCANPNCGKEFESNRRNKIYCCSKCARLVYRRLHVEKEKEYNDKYSISHREERRKKEKIYYSNNREKINARSRKHYSENAEKLRLKSKEYQETHFEKCCVRHANKRARIVGASGSFTPEEFINLCDEYGNKCPCCGKKGRLTVCVSGAALSRPLHAVLESRTSYTAFSF
jgi:hypothetical protein